VASAASTRTTQEVGRPEAAAPLWSVEAAVTINQAHKPQCNSNQFLRSTLTGKPSRCQSCSHLLTCPLFLALKETLFSCESCATFKHYCLTWPPMETYLFYSRASTTTLSSVTTTLSRRFREFLAWRLSKASFTKRSVTLRI